MVFKANTWTKEVSVFLVFWMLCTVWLQFVLNELVLRSYFDISLIDLFGRRAVGGSVRRSMTSEADDRVGCLQTLTEREMFSVFCKMYYSRPNCTAVFPFGVVGMLIDK